MNAIETAAMQLASLSVYRGILRRTVPGAFYRLLRAVSAPLEAFLPAWGEFIAVLAERGQSENFAACLTESALYDENAFSRAAAAGCRIPEAAMDAAKRDLEIILRAARITPGEVAAATPYAAELEALRLPRWETGAPVEPLRGGLKSCLEQMAAYYRGHSCGIYARYRAFIWRGGRIHPVAYPDRTRLADLRGYEVPRGAVVENTRAFLQGLPANNCLLYGDRGTGKSSTVKALLNEFAPQGLRVIEMPKENLMDFPALVDQIAGEPARFLVFIDDLSFSSQDDTYAALKAVLEGGLAARPENTLIYATSDRRHLVREAFSDREGDEVHRGDTIQESLSLADRFGLAVPFTLPGKQQYLEIVRGLAAERGLEDRLPELEAAAERWALERGGRSPRCARQFLDAAEGRLRRGLPL